MENLKFLEPQEPSPQIHEQTEEAVSGSGSVLNRLSTECLETFKALLKAANTNLSRANLTNLKRSRESLVLLRYIERRFGRKATQVWNAPTYNSTITG